MTGGGLFNALHVEPVCFLPSGRFEFARHMRDQTGHVLAVIIPALDEFGETANLVAWVPDTGVVATQPDSGQPRRPTDRKNAYVDGKENRTRHL